MKVVLKRKKKTKLPKSQTFSPSVENVRLLEDDEDRITEDGETRILE
jgi:hypothetical protein